MAHSRQHHQQTRRAALWVLYLIDVAGAEPADALATSRATMTELEPGLAEHWSLVEQRVNGVFELWDEVNDYVQSVSPRWKIARMAPVDRNILRLGAWELVYGQLETPIAVIDHCVELGKEYGEKSTSGFVNGLLDQLCRDKDISLR